ncbi:hypothetical protein KHA80_13750 [Anaerobacillus sp. HL2]|nr:hypothetical protein KHA80_13750 [Anaerobacillus sp. HL2]
MIAATSSPIDAYTDLPFWVFYAKLALDHDLILQAQPEPGEKEKQLRILAVIS